jgi:hypothetical protein
LNGHNSLPRFIAASSSYPCCSQEDVAMRNEFWDEIEDTLFAVAIAAAIGLGAANLAVQVTKERATLDAAAASERLSQLAYPQVSPEAIDVEAGKTAPAS